MAYLYVRHVYEFQQHFLFSFEICRYLFKIAALNSHSLFSNKSSALNNSTLDLSKIKDMFSLCNYLLKCNEFIKRNTANVFTVIYYYYNYYFDNSEVLSEVKF